MMVRSASTRQNGGIDALHPIVVAHSLLEMSCAWEDSLGKMGGRVACDKASTQCDLPPLMRSVSVR